MVNNMKLNILVVSKYKWRSRLKKHNEIKKLMGMDVRFTTLHTDLGTPEVKKERITEEWFEKNVTSLAKREDFNFVIFQFSERDGKSWGIDSGLRGTNFGDTDMFGEAWVCANENSVVKFKDGTKRNKYTKTVPHEIAHELKRQKFTSLEIHDYDYKNEVNNLEQFYIDLNQSIIDVLKAKIAALTKKVKYPLPNWEVTQAYGVPDPVTYPLTGHHIGTDFRALLDTEIWSVWDGEITRSGFTKALGFWSEVKYDGWYMVSTHLKYAPTPMKFKKGHTVGVIGNTGIMTAPHAHLEGWREPMNRSLLTKTNWHQLTFDITNKFK